MKKPLWQPTELKKKNSILADFAKFINFEKSSRRDSCLFFSEGLQRDLFIKANLAFIFLS